MRMFKRLAMTLAAAGVCLGSAAGVASASTATARPGVPAVPAVHLKSGNTSLTTAPGVAAALLSHGIVPLATLPGTEGAAVTKSGVAVKFTFPVTGGSVNLKQLTGMIGHHGGIAFIAPATGRELIVSNFVINLNQAVLTAIVDGNPKVRVPLLSLSLAHAKIATGWHAVRVSGIDASLTKTAAAALDATFSTTLFTPGLDLGTASTLIKY